MATVLPTEEEEQNPVKTLSGIVDALKCGKYGLALSSLEVYQSVNPLTLAALLEANNRVLEEDYEAAIEILEWCNRTSITQPARDPHFLSKYIENKVVREDYKPLVIDITPKEEKQ